MQLKYISPHGAELDLTNNADFLLTGCDGLTAANIDISSTSLGTHDGDIVNNTRALPRGIVLYLTIRQSANVETAKRNVLSVVKPKHSGILRWVQDGRSVDISGIVEAVTMARFVRGVVLQISLHCPQPYWEDTAYVITQIQEIVKLHHFSVAFPQSSGVVFGKYDLNMTRSIINDGDAEIGAVITIIATGNVTNPLLQRADGAFFGVNETLEAGESIVISTVKGKKTVTKNGANIIHKVLPGSTWLQLDVGENILTISEAGGTRNMYFSFEYRQKYV